LHGTRLQGLGRPAAGLRGIGQEGMREPGGGVSWALNSSAGSDPVLPWACRAMGGTTKKSPGSHSSLSSFTVVNPLPLMTW